LLPQRESAGCKSAGKNDFQGKLFDRKGVEVVARRLPGRELFPGQFCLGARLERDWDAMASSAQDAGIAWNTAKPLIAKQK
jgi:hypothetical protein